MKKEKNMLQDKFSAGKYLAPRVKVVKIKARRVMCSSIDGSDIEQQMVYEDLNDVW